jgi:hypothetical protein
MMKGAFALILFRMLSVMTEVEDAWSAVAQDKTLPPKYKMD